MDTITEIKGIELLELKQLKELCKGTPYSIHLKSISFQDLARGNIQKWYIKKDKKPFNFKSIFLNASTLEIYISSLSSLELVLFETKTVIDNGKLITRL